MKNNVLAGMACGALALLVATGCAGTQAPAPIIVGEAAPRAEASETRLEAETADDNAVMMTVADATTDANADADAATEADAEASLPVTPEGLLSGRSYRLRIDGRPADFCRDTYAFRDDGTMTIMSGEEVLEVDWSITENAQGGYALREEITATNGLADCQGETAHKLGDVGFKYITFEDEAATAYRVCYGNYLAETCYGVAERID